MTEELEELRAGHLLGAAIGGDGLAFRRLLEPHLAVMLRVAKRFVRAELAEDVVQESLVIGYRKLKRVQEDSKVRAFFLGIVSRKAQTMRRSEIRRRAREIGSLGAQAEMRTPHSLHEDSMLRAQIDDALSSLTSKRRQIAVLRLDGGLSFREIAEALGTSEGSARVQFSSAVKKLRTRLREIQQRSENEAA